MRTNFDVVVRGDVVVDGTGGDPYEGDVGIVGGRIAAIGEIAEKGLRGRFGVYSPPLLEALRLCELEHNPKNNRMCATRHQTVGRGTASKVA